MDPKPLAELVLEVPGCGEPVRGKLCEGGAERRFAGWMDFACALQRLGAWSPSCVRIVLEPAPSEADPAKPQPGDADAVSSWLALAAALQALGCADADGGREGLDPAGA